MLEPQQKQISRRHVPSALQSAGVRMLPRRQLKRFVVNTTRNQQHSQEQRRGGAVQKQGC